MSLPTRKHPRLKNYDYSQNNAYFITINIKDNLPILSSVGRGLAPADSYIILSPLGKIVEQQLREIPNKYPYISIDCYIIMPTHIHAVLLFCNNNDYYHMLEHVQESAGASPRPTLIDVVCSFKSITAILFNKHNNTPGRIIWQSSFYEKIIRNQKGYDEVADYILNNPITWRKDKYYCDN